MSLKSFIKSHMKDNLIADTISNYSEETCPFILILDDESSKILSTFYKMSDLINMQLFSVELLTKKRQPFKTMHAIYFISPSSLNLISNDFPMINKVSDFLYKRLHIYTTDKVTEYDMQQLIKPGLVNRILTFKESNINFYLLNKNIFYFHPLSNYTDFGYKGTIFSYLYFNSINSIEDKIKIFCERICSVCIVMKQFPNIVYFCPDKVCEIIAKVANKELSEFYDKNSNIAPNKNSLLLITSRNMDICGPLIQNHSYSSTIFDKFEKINGNTIKVNNTNYTLDDSDDLYEEFKNQDYISAIQGIQSKYEEFVNEVNANKKEINTTDDINIKMKSFDDTIKYKALFTNHITILNECEKINKIFCKEGKEKANYFFEIIDIFSYIVSGIFTDKSIIEGKKSERKKQFDTLYKMIKKYKDYITHELLIRFMCCLNYYYLNDEDLDTAIDNFGFDFFDLDPSQKKTIQFFSKNKPEFISKDLLNNLDKEILFYRTKISSKEEDLRKMCITESKLSTIIDMCVNDVLPSNLFKYLQNRKSNKKKKKRIDRFNMNQIIDDDQDKNYMFVFNFGGLSHYEISTIETKSKDLDYQIILGSNVVLNAHEYLEQVNIYVNQIGAYLRTSNSGAGNNNGSTVNKKGNETTNLVDN